MSFLAGMLDTQNQANRMGAQRDRNAIYERQQLLAEEEREYTKRTIDVNAEYDLASTSGWLDKNRLGLGDGFSDAVIGGDRNATDYAITMLNNADLVEGGGKITALVRDEGNGGFRATVTNPDGSIGAKTVNGSKDPTDETIFVSDKDLLSTANTMWDATVIPYQDKIRTAEVGATENVIGVSGAATEQEIKADRALRNDVAAVMNSVPPGASRAALAGVISSAKDPEEKREVVQKIAQDQQIELPSATAPAASLGTTTATAATPPSATPPSATAGGNSSLYDAVEQTESGGDHSAVSPAGATGVMQLMPETAKNPGFGIEPVKDDSEEENRRVGREYLDALLKKYDGNLDHALAAYNYGPGNIDEWIANGADPSQLPQETQDYIVKVKGAMSPTQPSAATPTQPSAATPTQPSAANVPDGFDPELNYTDDELEALTPNSKALTTRSARGMYKGKFERGSTQLGKVKDAIQADLKKLKDNSFGGETEETVRTRLEENKEKFTAMVGKSNAPRRKTLYERRQIAKLEEELTTNLTPARRKELETEKAEVEATENNAIVSDKPEIQQQFDDGSAMLDGKTPKEKADMIVNGEITLSPQARKTVAENLQRQGVQNLQDLKRLNNKDRAIALAALAGTVNSDAEASKIRQQILNLMDGGELMSRQDRATITQNARTYALRVREFTDKRLKEADEYGDKLIEETFALFNEEDVSLSDAADAVLQSGTLATYWSKLQRFNIKDSPKEHETLVRAANIVLTKVVAGLAQKADAGIFERLSALISRDDVTPENADAGDMFLKRVIKVGDTIQYISPPTLVDSNPPKWKYENIETSFPIEKLRSQNAAAANLIINVAEANSKRYGRPS